MQININLDINKDNRKAIIKQLEVLKTLGALSQYQLKDLKEEIDRYFEEA
jgi:hypothetical protein